ncbi:hypothetical protein LPJ78_003737 [Coemansia sp. RSA 989]|nr:hypothetical protein BX667DRAFT_501927 [Coemansia mojavensis]KAJ1740904.1 hypothetical protein LPJ68_003324 [Coemansia sp. RSA 1086]KAJ1749697.1 hypothetical protein LPJ79_003492 [Coemansia sp. RSA 1821]KAJ1863888.1 hypothetical protein LPJ78_003737 [Coemansia sp. RSA 989]KAJ2674342.1 hypothetical protein IWW42_001842 [Coemansia sp. RSA 1085]
MGETQTGFWPRLFRRASNERREVQWTPRPHANSTASAATVVEEPKSGSQLLQTLKSSKQRKLQRRPTLSQKEMHEKSVEQEQAGAVDERPAGDRARAKYSGLGIGQSHEDRFWQPLDRQIGQGEDAGRARVLVDAMVDEASEQMSGWRVENGQGTFNDVLGMSAVHPIVMAFLQAHIEGVQVALGPEHVWLAILQGLSGALRGAGRPAAHAEQGPGKAGLEAVWQKLRESSAVPRACVARGSGHEVRLFGSEMNARHAVHGAHGAAPLAMAAAAAGSSAAVAVGQIQVGRRLVGWRPQRRRTNPQWTRAIAAGRGVAGMALAGTLQTWSGLCVLARQLKETFSGSLGREIDWWLHRVYLLARDLADYFAAQQDGNVPDEWLKWLGLALFDGHSGRPRGACLDGWLAALFALDANGTPVHSRHSWALDWDCVPSGIDLLRVSPAGDVMNLYSGFVGVQVLRLDMPSKQRDASHSARSEEQRDAQSTLAGSREQLPEEGLASRRDLEAAFASIAQPAPAGPPPPRAIAPLIGWALDGWES